MSWLFFVFWSILFTFLLCLLSLPSSLSLSLTLSLSLSLSLSSHYPLISPLLVGPSSIINYDAFLRLNVRLDLIMDEMEVLKEGSGAVDSSGGIELSDYLYLSVLRTEYLCYSTLPPLNLISCSFYYFLLSFTYIFLSLSLSLSISLYPSLWFFLFLSLSPQTLMKMLRDSTGDRLTLNPIFSATPSSHLHNSTLLLSYLFSFSLFSSARPHSSPIISFFFFSLLISFLFCFQIRV